jgi:hypothetical protein
MELLNFLHNFVVLRKHTKTSRFLSKALRPDPLIPSRATKARTLSSVSNLFAMFKRISNVLTQGFPPKPTFTENNLSDLSGKVSQNSTAWHLCV